MPGPPQLDVWQLALAALLVLANAGASLALQLGLGRQLLVASIRAVVQLLLLGLVLDVVFSADGAVAVVLLMLAMAIVAGVEAVRRTSHRAPGLFGASIGVVTAVGMAITFYGTVGVLGIETWHDPRYVIPILGMILGNTLNGISLGLETVLSGFVEQRARVELLLSFGATRREASRDVVRRAVRTGMIPILNSMAVSGLVSIPGMMTGQMLAGASPLIAARYQIFILFCIASGVALGTVGVVLLATRLLFDERDRLRLDRLTTLAD